jgi:hypothetical protein
MWLTTQYGFYSIVNNAEDSYFVRAQIRQDLVNLVDLLEIDAEVHEWKQANYRYRIIIDLEVLLEIMVQLACSIDYPNFKARIYHREEQSHKLRAYQNIWNTMATLQS